MVSHAWATSSSTLPSTVLALRLATIGRSSSPTSRRGMLPMVAPVSTNACAMITERVRSTGFAISIGISTKPILRRQSLGGGSHGLEHPCEEVKLQPKRCQRCQANRQVAYGIADNELAGGLAAG